MADLVSYNDKHNEANGEGNRDGESHNRSWNCGVEGPTDDPAVLALRQRQRRNLLTTLLLSQGVPMILGGDELKARRAATTTPTARTARPRFDWRRPPVPRLVQDLIGLRRAHPVFRRRRWFHHHPIRGTTEIAWLRPDGQPMSDSDWDNGYAKAVGVLLDGEAISTPDRFGGRVVDDTFYVMLNASELDLSWVPPSKARRAARHGLLDGAAGHRAVHQPGSVSADAALTLLHRSIVVLRSPRPDGL